MRTLTKYTPAAGSEARSRPRTLLLCLNTQGRLIIMNYGNTTGTSVSLLVANSTTLRRAVSSAAHKFHFFARSSDFDTGVQVDSEISFLSFARKSASATPVLSPWNWASTSQYSRSYFSGSAANSIFLAFFSKRFSVRY